MLVTTEPFLSDEFPHATSKELDAAVEAMKGSMIAAGETLGVDLDAAATPGEHVRKLCQAKYVEL